VAPIPLRRTSALSAKQRTTNTIRHVVVAQFERGHLILAAAFEARFDSAEALSSPEAE
jgi:hypothetical protein